MVTVTRLSTVYIVVKSRVKLIEFNLCIIDFHNDVIYKNRGVRTEGSMGNAEITTNFKIHHQNDKSSL